MQRYIKPEHWANFLDEYDWTHWCTFTTKWELTIPAARRMADKIGNEFCGKKLGIFQVEKPLFFWAAEPFDTRNGYHIHALIRTGAEKEDIYQWTNKRYGRSLVLNYEKGKGASGYCAKYITKKLSDYDIKFY